LNVNNRSVKTDVELWDCSGNPRYQASWPALYWETNGVIFVFNPEDESHGNELDNLYENFAKKSRLTDTQFVVFAHVKDNGNGNRKGVKLCKLMILKGMTTFK
jgi:Rab-like protein 5